MQVTLESGGDYIPAGPEENPLSVVEEEQAMSKQVLKDRILQPERAKSHDFSCERLDHGSFK